MDPIQTVMSWGPHVGIAGLLGVMLLERILPVLPSYGLLVAVGIASGAGVWPVTVALVACTAGGLLGCLAFYGVASALGEERSARLLKRCGRLFGVSHARVDRLTAYFREHQRALAFGSQLVPTVRLLAPGIAGLLRADPRTFIAASACGVALWNGLFIGLGYVASIAAKGLEASTLALQISVVLLVAEGLALAGWRWLVRRRSAVAPKAVPRAKPRKE